MEIYNKNIRFIRKKLANANQRVFAEKLKIPRSTLSAYESDTDPAFSRMIKLAKIYNIDLIKFSEVEMTEKNMSEFFFDVQRREPSKSEKEEKEHLFDLLHTIINSSLDPEIREKAMDKVKRQFYDLQTKISTLTASNELTETTFKQLFGNDLEE